jgi:magnesium transporter
VFAARQVPVVTGSPAYLPRQATTNSESVAHNLVTDVPTAQPEQSAAVVRESLVGKRYADASHVFVVADGGRLLGVARIGDLLGAVASTPVSALMKAVNCHVVTPDTDREKAASVAIRAGVSTLAVCDRDRRFIGSVPAAALMSILRDEHLEDLHHMAGILAKSEAARAALVASPLRRAMFRLPWLLLGLAGSTIITALMARFETSLSAHIAVAFFIPALVFLTDSVGTQSETIAVRAFSLSDTSLRSLFVGELATGIIVGLLLSGLAFTLIWMAFGSLMLGLAVAIALFFGTLVATAIGVLLPWIFDRFGFDPALSSGPIATVFQDGSTLVIYLLTAAALLS